ncbi:MAG: divalent metal cation transporter [Planctomycetes bacterium]|nr:divalent metal cation transporter [Planctomycetota bacterium]
MLIAATGVGAGDLITASLAGSAVGVGIAWAAVAGGVFKWTMNEGLARWQLATGTTLLEGWNDRLGATVRWVFFCYLMVWSLFTGAALISACGIAGAGIYDFGLEPSQAKLIWGVFHSLVGLALVWIGGFALFEKLMSVCIAVMFCAVMVTAISIKPDWSAIGSALLNPTFGNANETKESIKHVLGVLGGVGGSVTLLSYGYWIRETNRKGIEGVRACRLDLAVGYGMTSLFGVAMLVIGSRLEVTKSGEDIVIQLAAQLEGVMGAAGTWLFLIGFWGAVFSSLLGVWQSIPYLFADFMLIRSGASADERRKIDYTKTKPYRIFLVALAIVPMVMINHSLRDVQIYYAVLAALFMPFLAATLLIMNNRTAWVGRKYRNGLLTNAILIITLLFFGYVGYLKFIEFLA